MICSSMVSCLAAAPSGRKLLSKAARSVPCTPGCKSLDRADTTCQTRLVRSPSCSRSCSRRTECHSTPAMRVLMPMVKAVVTLCQEMLDCWCSALGSPPVLGMCLRRSTTDHHKLLRFAKRQRHLRWKVGRLRRASSSRSCPTAMPHHTESASCRTWPCRRHSLLTRRWND